MEFHVSSPVLLQPPATTTTLDAEAPLKTVHILGVAAQKLPLPLQAVDEVMSLCRVCCLAGERQLSDEGVKYRCCVWVHEEAGGEQFLSVDERVRIP